MQRYAELGAERRLVLDVHTAEHGLGEAQVAQVDAAAAVADGRGQHGQDGPLGGERRAVGGRVHREHARLAALAEGERGAVPGLRARAAARAAHDQVDGRERAQRVRAADELVRLQQLQLVLEVLHFRCLF